MVGIGAEAETAYLRYRAVRYFGSLDALRCLAIVGVVWQHYPAIPHAHMPFTDAGAAGVGLFFALSGFLITTLLLREESENGQVSLRKFYLRRSLRIFPLYYAVLGLYAFLVLLREDNAAGRLFLSNLPYYLTYTSNWFVDLVVNEDGQRRVIFIFAWSLATEEQFYLFWPVIFRFFNRRIAIAVLVLVMSVDLALTFSIGKPSLPTTLSDRLLKIATSPSTEICVGVLWALTLHSRTGFGLAWRLLGNWWAAPVSAGLALAVGTWQGGPSAIWYLAMALSLSVLVASSVIREDHGLNRILRLTFLARIGVVSYGVYMLHMLAVNLVKIATSAAGVTNSAISFGLALALAYALAEVSFRYFESPLLRLKERLNANPSVQAHQTHDVR